MIINSGYYRECNIIEEKTLRHEKPSIKKKRMVMLVDEYIMAVIKEITQIVHSIKGNEAGYS